MDFNNRLNSGSVRKLRQHFEQNNCVVNENKRFELKFVFIIKRFSHYYYWYEYFSQYYP
jgi:predicted component of type VI protein secretion system